ncbi:MAG: YaaC family protein [Actinomycetota bacterium]|nr:YaaC family protein [Actinomycetota bacterium]
MATCDLGAAQARRRGRVVMRVAGSKVWASLSAYESTELVRRFSKERIGPEINATKAREIAAYFAQGREYFRNAAGAGELVRPLILYYGAVALARGTVLFLDASKSKVVADHGLDGSGWDDLNAKPGAVPELPVKIKGGGTFPELARVSGNSEWCTVRNEGMPGEVTVRSPGPELAPGTGVTMKEALGQIPDVADLYERTFGEHSRRLRCEVQVTGLPEPDLVDAFTRNAVASDQEVRRHAWLGVVPTQAGLPDKDWVANILGNRVAARDSGPNLLYFAREPVHRVAESHSFDLYYDAGTEERPRLDMPVSVAASGEEYLKLPTDGRVILSTLLALHTVAYAAGVLVRYHPGYWAAIVGRTKGDSIAPVLSAAVSTVEERYPLLILEVLEG